MGFSNKTPATMALATIYKHISKSDLAWLMEIIATMELVGTTYSIECTRWGQMGRPFKYCSD